MTCSSSVWLFYCRPMSAGGLETSLASLKALFVRGMCIVYQRSQSCTGNHMECNLNKSCTKKKNSRGAFALAAESYSRSTHGGLLPWQLGSSASELQLCAVTPCRPFRCSWARYPLWTGHIRELEHGQRLCVCCEVRGGCFACRAAFVLHGLEDSAWARTWGCPSQT